MMIFWSRTFYNCSLEFRFGKIFAQLCLIFSFGFRHKNGDEYKSDKTDTAIEPKYALNADSVWKRWEKSKMCLYQKNWYFGNKGTNWVQIQIQIQCPDPDTRSRSYIPDNISQIPYPRYHIQDIWLSPIQIFLTTFWTFYKILYFWHILVLLTNSWTFDNSFSKTVWLVKKKIILFLVLPLRSL